MAQQRVGEREGRIGTLTHFLVSRPICEHVAIMTPQDLTQCAFALAYAAVMRAMKGAAVEEMQADRVAARAVAAVDDLVRASPLGRRSAGARTTGPRRVASRN